MTDRELMQMALDALDKYGFMPLKDEIGWQHFKKTIEALRARLAQPEPDSDIQAALKSDNWAVQAVGMAALQKKYTAPAQREWQGLTDEEMRSLWDDHVVPMFGRKHMNPIVFGRIIEDKLKEKNHG